MNDLVPSGSRIDRGALERIIQRAAELQAGERDIGEGLTEHELMRLGQEVGIPPSYLQQALLEERTRAVATVEPGIAGWLVGPTQLAAQRTIPGEAKRIRDGLNRWMTESELLAVKRRYPEQTSWEAKQDVLSSIKREFKLGGRSYQLSRAKEIVGQVVQLDQGRAHVRLVADLTNTRRAHLGSAATLAGAGAIASLIGVVMGVMLPVALAPLGLGLLTGLAVARRRRGTIERVQVNLEQVLDRLEHGEIETQPRVEGPRQSAFVRIADEIRKTLGP
ncbi:MAG: hypothetical protein JSW43_09345 [Gemmatimonadota bacterium]|nr:MAG: hypothetical protein JSW43_09345 [Gemmatimonadota bacterium]